MAGRSIRRAQLRHDRKSAKHSRRSWLRRVRVRGEEQPLSGLGLKFRQQIRQSFPGIYRRRLQSRRSPRLDPPSPPPTYAPGPDTFPITSFTWIYLRKTSSDAARASAIRNFLDWIYTQGQPFVSQEGYSELPTPLLPEVKRRAKNLAAAD